MVCYLFDANRQVLIRPMEPIVVSHVTVTLQRSDHGMLLLLLLL